MDLYVMLILSGIVPAAVVLVSYNQLKIYIFISIDLLRPEEQIIFPMLGFRSCRSNRSNYSKIR